MKLSKSDLDRHSQSQDTDARAVPAQNLYGQQMGRKGQRTRQRLMTAALELFETRSIRDVSVADIATLAGTAPSAFYIYFADVKAIALALAESINQITPEMSRLLAQPWTRAGANEKALRLVNAYVQFWGRNHAILRLRNLAGDEGDKRFEDVRHRSVAAIHELLEARIADADNGLDPPSGASAVLALMERIAAIARLPLRRHHSRKSLVSAAAFLVASALIAR